MEVLFILVGLAIGWYAERILWEIKRIRASLKPQSKSGVVAPNITKPYKSSTTIVSPKTPARMQYEIDLEMKRQAGLIE